MANKMASHSSVVWMLCVLCVLCCTNALRITNHGPAYDVNHTSLGCPNTLPCRCHMSYDHNVPEKVINCTNRKLKEVPMFVELVGYSFDRLMLNGNYIRSIPHNAFQGPEVRLVDLSDNSIMSVSDNGFMRSEGIEQLKLDNCQLTSSPPSLHFLTKLRRLSLRNNAIKTLTTVAFQLLVKLDHLDVSHNPIQFAPPFDVFKTLAKLKVLKLDSCEMPSLPPELLGSLENLEHLSLKNNNITRIAHTTFDNIPKLKELDLEGNSIVFKNFKEFEVLKHLKILKLGHCRVSTVNAHLVRHIPHVHTLVMRHCHIQKVAHGAFRNLFHLSKVDLSGNPKVKVTDRLFHGVEERMKYVGIENMNLTSFPTSAFRKLFLLKKIRADRNSIQSLPKGVFHSLKGRHVEVHLEKNEITEIEAGVLNGIRRPMRIFLQHNNVSSLSFMEEEPCAFYESEINLIDNPLHCDCNTALALEKKAFTIQGTCQEGDALFRGLPLMPDFKQPPQDGTQYLVTLAPDQCPVMTRNKTEERYDCACNEWLWMNSTRVCSGQAGMGLSQSTLNVMIYVSLVILAAV